MAKIGDITAITLDGTKYAVPKDTEPHVIKGGETITETRLRGRHGGWLCFNSCATHNGFAC